MTDKNLLFHGGRNRSGPWALPQEKASPNPAPNEDSPLGRLYENSLRHAATHLLTTELSQPAVWQALERVRAFVAFDWLVNASGFDFAATAGGERHEMGSRVKLTADLLLTGRAPLSAHWKLMRSGKLITETTGETLNVKLTEPGIYRVELWLDVAGEKRIWILSNPIHVAVE